MESNDTLKSSSTEHAVEWLRDHAIKLDTVEPREDKSDLAPIENLIGSSRIVGLGEATHGTKEFFQVKHRLVEYLIEEMGFDTVVFECPKTNAERINRYVKGEGEPEENILKGLTYEVWRAQEVLDFINWLKEFNKHSNNSINFYGCDVDDQTGMTATERDKSMAANVLDIAKASPGSKIALWAHNGHINHTETSSFRPLGKNLKETFGHEYISFGSLFNEGSFAVREGSLKEGSFNNERSVVNVGPVTINSYEQIFARSGLSLAVFDIRGAKEDESLDALRNSQLTVRQIGWQYDKSESGSFLDKTDLSQTFDLIVWVEHTSASTSL